MASAWAAGPPPGILDAPETYDERWALRGGAEELAVGIDARVFVWRGGARPAPYRDASGSAEGVAEWRDWAIDRAEGATGWRAVPGSLRSRALRGGADVAALPTEPGAATLAVVVAGAGRKVRWTEETGEAEVALGHGDVAVFAENWPRAAPRVAPSAGLSAHTAVHCVGLAA